MRALDFFEQLSVAIGCQFIISFNSGECDKFDPLTGEH